MSRFGFIFKSGCQESEAIAEVIRVAGLSLKDGFYMRQDAEGHIFVLPKAQTTRFADIHPFLVRCAFSTVISKAEKIEYYRLSVLFREADIAWRRTPELGSDDPEYA